MGLGITGQALGGVVLGIGLIWFLISRIKQGEQDRATLGGEKAHTQGQIDADEQARQAKEAADNAKANAGKNPTDW